MKTILITLCTLGLLFLPLAVTAQEPVACEQDYTVQAGDTLTSIAAEQYGKSGLYPAIVVATNLQAETDSSYHTIGKANLIVPGWKLCIPSAEDAATLTPSAGAPSPQPESECAEGLSQEDLATATYTTEFTQAGTATLTDGQYSEQAAPGSATETKVILTPYIACGQLNGQDAAAAVVVTDPGGSGTFYSLHAMVGGDEGPEEVAFTSLGDRIQINSITIEDNQIVVDMVQAGPDDPMCCPSQHVIKTYALEGDQLVEVSGPVVAAGGSEPAQGLEGTSWILTTLNGAKPLPETPVTAGFGEDGELNGSDGCNRYGAFYQVDGDTITITLGPTTLMACPAPIMKQANAYQAALTSAATYQIQGDTLELRDAAGEAVATFSAQPTSLEGTSWNVISYNNGKEAVVSVIIGTELTAVFGTDGDLTGSAGCNGYAAPYEADDEGNISIGPAITIFMMCDEPEGIMEQEKQYLAALETAATYRMEGVTMEMRTAEGSMAANFKRAP